jgi:hypothetical protein
MLEKYFFNMHFSIFFQKMLDKRFFFPKCWGFFVGCGGAKFDDSVLGAGKLNVQGMGKLNVPVN